MNFEGVIIGASAFLIIGICHPIVIKGEYYFGKGIWPIFLVVGLILVGISLFMENQMLSAIVSVAGFSSLWSIHEIFEQEKRVQKGWFPANPKRKAKR